MVHASLAMTLPVSISTNDIRKALLYVGHSAGNRVGPGMGEWTCQTYDTAHERNINAARNILATGRQRLSGGNPPRLQPTEGYQVNGGRVSSPAMNRHH